MCENKNFNEFADVACTTRPVLCAKQEKGGKTRMKRNTNKSGSTRGTPNMAERIVCQAASMTSTPSAAKDDNKENVVALCHRLLELHERSVWLAAHNREALAQLRVRKENGKTSD